MIKDIITYLNLKLESVGYFNTIHCLAEQVKKGDKIYPAIYNGANEYQDIALNDNLGSIAYWRKSSNVSISEQENKTTSNGVEYLTSFTLKLVCFVQKENGSTNDQYFADNLATVIISNLTTNSSALKQALKAKKVSVIAEQYITDGRVVSAGEFENVAFEPNYTHSLFSIDFKISIITNNQCFSDLCNDTPIIFTPSVTNNGYCTKILIKTEAEWALDNTVYSERTLLVTSDAYYGTTDQRKFKLSDGVQTWSDLDYMPIGSAPSIDETLVVQTAAQWAADTTVYSNKRILVTSDEYYGSTDQRKFKIADGTQTWSNLDYAPISQTLAQVLANDNKTGEQVINSDNGNSTVSISNSNTTIGYSDGTTGLAQVLVGNLLSSMYYEDYNTGDFGLVKIDKDVIRLQHTSTIEISSPVVKLIQSYLKGNNEKSVLHLSDTYSRHYWEDLYFGQTIINNTRWKAYHDLEAVIQAGNLIDLQASSVTKNGYEIATESFVDNRVQSNIKIVGDWDATSGSYPLADESNVTPFITQWGTTIKQGWAWRIGYGQAGTVGGFYYEEGDVIYALVDSPTNTAADWGDIDHNLQQATESLRGTAKITTNAIIDDETTTDDEKIVTPYKFWSKAIPRFKNLAHTFAQKITFTLAPRFSSTTANQRLEVDANKDLISVAKGTADNKDFGTTSGTVCEGNDTRLTDARNSKTVFKSNILISHTGTTSNTKKYSSLIPAGTFQANDIFRWFAKIGATSNANTKTIRFYFNTTDDLLGSPILVATYALSSGATAIGMSRALVFQNSLTSQQIGNPSAAFQSEYSALAAVLSTVNVDFTVAQYFIVAEQLNNSADTMNLFYIYSEITR